MRQKKMRFPLILAMTLAPISSLCAQDFTRADGPIADAESLTRATLLKAEKAPLIAFSSTINPISPDSPGTSDISTQKGKVTVLYFFSATCGRCIQASQQIGSIFLTTTRNEVTVIGIMSSSDTFDASLAAATKYRIPFAVVQDKTDKTFTSYGISGVPTFCIIGASGKVSKYCYADTMRFCVMSEVVKNRQLQAAKPETSLQRK